MLLPQLFNWVLQRWVCSLFLLHSLLQVLKWRNSTFPFLGKSHLFPKEPGFFSSDKVLNLSLVVSSDPEFQPMVPQAQGGWAPSSWQMMKEEPSVLFYSQYSHPWTWRQGCWHSFSTCWPHPRQITFVICSVEIISKQEYFLLKSIESVSINYFAEEQTKQLVSLLPFLGSRTTGIPEALH